MKKIKPLLCVMLCLCLALLPLTPAFAQAADNTLPFEDSAFFEYGDYSIHYRVLNADNQKGQIFMIHGFALSSYCFEALAKELQAKGYTCVLADLPDFGYSTRETAQTDMLPREDIMHALMTHLSDEPWYVAGHSMGGYIALALAQKYPQSVKNLLLYGTAGNEGVDEATTQLMSNPIFIKLMGSVMQTMAQNTLLVKILYTLAVNDRAYAASYDYSKITDPYRIDGTGMGAIYSFSMLPVTDFDAVSEMPPILFVNGDSDKVITDKNRVALRNALPDGSMDIVMKNGGHMFIENMAEKTADITVDFILTSSCRETELG